MIRRIFHISDIHIRLASRQVEYQNVFALLYEKINKFKISFEQSCIVITGDLFHEKNKLTPECVIIAREFLKTLTELCSEVIIIAGNHDLLENNPDKPDSISAIIEDLSIKYLKLSGFYTVKNIVFGVTSLIDKQLTRISKAEIKSENKIYIALFHGLINGASLDNNQIIQRDSLLKLEDFEGYDIVLLGDVHKHQLCNGKSFKGAYAGSLIQQSFGESIFDHGMVIWNIQNRKNVFYRIRNNHCFLKIYINDNKLSYDLIDENFIEYYRIRCYIKNTPKNIVDQLINKFKCNHNVIFEQYIYEDSGNEIAQIDDIKLLINDDIIIDEQLVKSPEINELFIREYHNKLSLAINKPKNADIQYWRINRLEFQNALIYGDGSLNIIEFNKMHDVISICGNNAIGKSCIIKLIIFALFDKVGYGRFDKSSIINKNHNECFIAIEFSSGNTKKYRIERRGRMRKKEGTNVAIFTSQFYEITEGERICLNNENNIKTGIDIKQLIGIEMNDFIMCNVFNNLSLNIVDITEFERLELLFKYFQLDWYKQMFDICKRDCKEIEKEINFLTGQRSLIIKSNYDNKELERLNNELKFLESKIIELSMQKINTVENIDELIDYGIDLQHDFNINEIKKEYYDKKTKLIPGILVQESELIEKYRQLLNELVDEVENNNDLDTINVNIINASYNLKQCRNGDNILLDEEITWKNLEQYEQKFNEMSNKWNFDNIDVEISESEYNNTVARIKQIEYSKLIEMIITGIFDDYEKCRIYNKHLQFEEYLNMKSQYNNMKYTYWYNTLEYYKHQKRQFEIQKEVDELRAQIEIIDKQKIINDELEILYRQIKQYEYNTYYIAITNNTNIDNQLRGLMKKNKTITEEIVRIESTIENNKLHNRLTTEIIEKEQHLKYLQWYLKLVDKDGIPYDLMIKKLKMVEIELNKFLVQFVGYTVNFEIEFNNKGGKMIIQINKNGFILNCQDLSGFETFILKIGFKMILTRMNHISKFSIIFIDEGLDCIDANNFDRLDKLFSYLRSQYEKVMVLTHIEDIHRFDSFVINIVCNNGISKLTYSEQ